jgi:hypothetical protein
MCVSLKKIKNKLSILSFGLNINKTLNFNIDIFAMFKTKHGLNKMHLLMVS